MWIIDHVESLSLMFSFHIYMDGNYFFSSFKSRKGQGTLFACGTTNTATMKLDAIVKKGDVVAHFTVTPGGSGVYHADLINYQGSPEATPPARITLVRSVRRWTGSCDRQELLNELGEIIDSVNTNAPIFRNDINRERKRKTGKKNSSPEQ